MVHSAYRKDLFAWLTTPRGMCLFLMLLGMFRWGEGAVYWAYVPDPPLLHPSTWEGLEVPVRVNNTHLLGSPAVQKMVKESERFNYTDSRIGLPICFGKNSTVPGCLNVTFVPWSNGENGTQIVRLCAPEGNRWEIHFRLPSLIPRA